MYDIIKEIIGHDWVTGDSEQQYIYYACIVLILLLTVFFIDCVYRFIFWVSHTHK